MTRQAGPTDRSARVLYQQPPIQLCPKLDEHRFVEAAQIIPSARRPSYWRQPADRTRARRLVIAFTKVVLFWLLAPLWFARNSGRIEVSFDIEFTATNCPHCGALLRRHCERDEHHYIRNSEDTHCRDCSDRYWWTILADQSSDLEVLTEWADRTLATFMLTNGVQVNLLRYSLTKLKDVNVVCAVNDRGELRGDVAQAIRLQAGIENLEERQTRVLRVGETWRRPAGALPATEILFVVARRADQSATTETVRAAVNGVLGSVGLKSERLALPVIGSGTGGLDAGAVGRIYGECLREWGRKSSMGLQSVTIVGLSQEVLDRFLEEFSSSLSGGSGLDAGTPQAASA